MEDIAKEDILKMLNALPDVSFIDEEGLEAVQAQMVDDYQTKYKEVTGKTQTLSRADPATLILYACSVQIYQMMLFLDMAGKQSLLKYAYGSYLDNLAALKGIKRKEPGKATVTVRFILSEKRTAPVGIPAGTKVSAGSVYFETTEYNEIPAGETETLIVCTCTEAGTTGNGLEKGSVNTLVDPIAYVAAVESVDASAGGTDTESDDDLRYRVYAAPFSWSTAGPQEAYRYWAMEYNSEISDVYVGSPEPGEVLVEFLMQDGVLPEASIVSGLQEYLASEEIRPLTDKVTVQAPETVSFDINLTYYINRSDRSKASSIQEAVETAVTVYRAWQGARIGRDINPSELIRQVIQAGAKRAEVTAPAFTKIPETAVAKAKTVTVTYGGLEDD